MFAYCTTNAGLRKCSAGRFLIAYCWMSFFPPMCKNRPTAFSIFFPRLSGRTGSSPSTGEAASFGSAATTGVFESGAFSGSGATSSGAAISASGAGATALWATFSTVCVRSCGLDFTGGGGGIDGPGDETGAGICRGPGSGAGAAVVTGLIPEGGDSRMTRYPA